MPRGAYLHARSVERNQRDATRFSLVAGNRFELEGIDEFDGEQPGLLCQILRASPVVALAGVS